LRAHVKRLVIVEFDIPDLPRGSDAYVASLAQRYERALGEYEGATRDLVAQGFLIPMFLGQLDAQTAATNWEHPAAVWRDQLERLAGVSRAWPTSATTSGPRPSHSWPTPERSMPRALPPSPAPAGSGA
jgi:hypothetical protein